MGIDPPTAADYAGAAAAQAQDDARRNAANLELVADALLDLQRRVALLEVAVGALGKVAQASRLHE